MFFFGAGGIGASIAIEAILVVVTFVIAYRRNRRYFHRSVWGAIGIAIPAALICPVGVLLFYAVSD